MAARKASRKSAARGARTATSARKTKKKTTAGRGKKSPTELIISKSRTKAASSLNVSGEFYAALDGAVRSMIAAAEGRAENNGRRTLRPHDL